MDIETLVNRILTEMKCPKGEWSKMELKVVDYMNEFYPLNKTKHFSLGSMEMKIAICVARICLAEVAEKEFNAKVINWDKLNWKYIVDGRSFIDKDKQYHTIEEIKEDFRQLIPFRNDLTLKGDYFERGILQKM